ncbi:MAG TPA: dihydrolipoamide acetyltransferase family protein [Candidatus Binatia bacterium]
MATDVIMPALGVAQEKGTLINWLKVEGQSVIKGEPLMEVETDKATVEIEAPASGILTNVIASPGDEIPVGNKIALILAPGEKAEGTSAKPSTAVRARAEAAPQKPAKTELAPARTEESRPSGIIPASPAARRIAREKRVDLSTLRGTGPEGAILAEDVARSLATETPASGGPPRIKETVQLTPMRRIVGERMAKSKQSAPHFYLSMDVDMTEINRKRNALKTAGEAVVPSINDYILAASARALSDFPSLNAAFTDKGVELYTDINLGMAVAIEDGLVVPVIRNADRLSLAGLAKESRALAEKAQKKKLFPLDYEGGTFTVSNLGMFGVDNFVAIINPPQCAILAVGQVAPRVIAHGEGIAVRPMMTMSLSADHRVVDGAMAARFLQEIKAQLEKADF